ncbi:MAG: DUF2958 domain-containing protein [Gemmataceae bacterium]
MRDDAYDYLPASLASHIPRLYTTEKLADPTIFIKLFTPDSNWTWYLLEYDPAERLGFGLVIGHEQELGYFSLEEMEESRGPLELRIERDLHFKPLPLSQVRDTQSRKENQ